jgi:L-ascorbate metabolism protein UlaG (beta-lactamase superfamily)
MVYKDSKQIFIKFTHIRHALSCLEFGNTKLIIDPMLSEKDSLPPVILTRNKSKNPLVPLPFTLEEIIRNSNYVLVTHLHFDHFDTTAAQVIPKETPIICSKFDKRKLEKLEFKNIQAFEKTITIGDLSIARYSAEHGSGWVRFLLGRGSSYLISYKELKFFITGDCILNPALEKRLLDITPDVVIANGGAARFRFGKPITMTIRDVQKISTKLPNAKVIVVHLNALNHCTENRSDYFNRINENLNICFPDNGEEIELTRKYR